MTALWRASYDGLQQVDEQAASDDANKGGAQWQRKPQ